ncbi:hypothetical protein F5B18DRAFT_671123 [Nemania serpens]|nr:hypothetical protein F5B18DRAFT_671123 [Nemania serpens]
MPTHSVLGEDHTPIEELDSVGVLIYLDDRHGNLQILVRSKPHLREPVYSCPGQEPRPEETAVDCARRAAAISLGADIPERQLEYRMSTVIENLGEQVKIRVFILKVSPRIASEIEYATRRTALRGWKYEFLPPSALECVYFHRHIGVTRVALRELLKTC